MSYNGSGTFVINTAGQPVVSGTVISSTAFNALTADLATGLSTAITKDGQTTPTANIPMGNNKITGLAVGTAATDAANLSQVQSTAAKLVNSVSGADTITGTMSPNLGAYATGQMFYFVAVGANTGAVTINIDSLGAKSITRDGTTALAAGDIQSGEVCVIVYDGTQFQLVNGASQSASIVTENLTVNKATVLNESGGDNDTRIEGDTDANLFFADASTDRIGIGTSSPQGILHASSTTTPQVIVQNQGGGSNARRFALAMNADDTFKIVSLNDNATVRTDNIIVGNVLNGNVGIGVVPSAFSSSFKAIQFGSNGAIWSFGASGNNTTFASNVYYDASVTPLYLTNGNATRYQQFGGSHLWYTAPSGTAGNAITFTETLSSDASGTLTINTQAGNNTNIAIAQAGSIKWYIGNVNSDNAFRFYDNTAATERMRLDSSGRLGIGTTSPSEKLEVAGAVKLTAGNLSVVPSTTTNAAVTICTNGGGTFFAGLDNSTGGTFGVGNYSSVLYNGANTPMVFFTNATERARITAGGDWQVKTGASAAVIAKGGDTDAEGWNGAQTSLYVGKVNGTGRSINAGGTINASGTDYAEYMTKAGDFVIAKGDVCGIDANGKLTNVFADAVSFVVKSTNPSYVGGDSWGIGIEGEELESARQKVDRIAFAGQVPVNVLGATPGQYIVPVDDNGAIKGMAVSNPTFEQYQSAVGKVIAVQDDGRALIIVKVA